MICDSFVVLDIETTGFSPESHEITEIGALKVVEGQVVDHFSQLINPKVPIPENIVEITGITDDMVRTMPTIDRVMPDFIDFVEDLPIMGHNVSFDFSFLKTNAVRLGLRFEKHALDTLLMARIFKPNLDSKSLTALCQYYNIDRDNAHRAYDDAKATLLLYQYFRNDPKAEVLSKAFIPKQIFYKPKKRSPITPKQVRFLKELCDRNDHQLDQDIESLTKSEASRHINDLLLRYGNR